MKIESSCGNIYNTKRLVMSQYDIIYQGNPQGMNKKRHPLTGMACFSNWNLLAVTLPFALPCLYYRLLLAW